MRIKNILIVCTGNTARSPVGEYLGKYYAKKYNTDLIFDSTGFINAFSYMQPESQQFLHSKGISHTNFKPKIISRYLLQKQDLIITMEEYHAERIKQNFRDIPGIENKTFTIREFTGGSGDVIDPYYEGNSTYLKVMKELDELIEQTVKKIIKINEENA